MSDNYPLATAAVEAMDASTALRQVEKGRRAAALFNNGDVEGALLLLNAPHVFAVTSLPDVTANKAFLSLVDRKAFLAVING